MIYLILIIAFVILNNNNSSRKTEIMYKFNLNEIYEKYGKLYNVDPKLLKAISIVESNENPYAENPRDPSYGLMQILCKTNAEGRIINQFFVEGWPPASKNDLFDPDYNVSIGAQILAYNIRKYGVEKGVAVYNAWSARKTLPGYQYPNQGYVDKVMSTYNSLV